MLILVNKEKYENMIKENNRQKMDIEVYRNRIKDLEENKERLEKKIVENRDKYVVNVSKLKNKIMELERRKKYEV